jgi:nucleotide-binding universal stress UspA family protein
MDIFKNILIGVDGSNDGYEAMKYGIKIAKLTHAKVTFLYIETDNFIINQYKGVDSIEKSRSQVDDFLLFQARTEEIGKDLFQKIKEYIESQKLDLNYELKSRLGNPRIEFVNEIKQTQYDLCILGKDSASKSFTTVFGKISDFIIKETKVPVLIVHNNI